MNRINEIKAIGSNEFPIIPKSHNFNVEREIKKIRSDKYLEMTVFPLLTTVKNIFNLMFTHVQALNLVDTLRPNDPIPFIANFMLNNKKYMKNLDDFIN